MKNLTLILIVAAFALTTACTDSERVLPTLPDQHTDYLRTDNNGEVPTYQPNIKATDVSVEKAPNLEVSYTENPNGGNCSTCDDETRQPSPKYFGELLPASFIDCGTFIRLTDDQLFEVFNPQAIQDHPSFKTGGPVAFSYVTSEDLPSSCGIGTTIELVTISFLPKNGTKNNNTKGKKSGNN